MIKGGREPLCFNPESGKKENPHGRSEKKKEKKSF
jgi:hypothetical protein